MERDGLPLHEHWRRRFYPGNNHRCGWRAGWDDSSRRLQHGRKTGSGRVQPSKEQVEYPLGPRNETFAIKSVTQILSSPGGMIEADINQDGNADFFLLSDLAIRELTRCLLFHRTRLLSSCNMNRGSWTSSSQRHHSAAKSFGDVLREVRGAVHRLLLWPCPKPSCRQP